MTREEYLNQLKNNLSSLTIDEQNEALQYYSDYFEDADNDEKIMAEFGTPEELAKSIVEKMANGLSKVESETKNSEDKSSFKRRTTDGILFYSFNKEDVRNLLLTFSAAEVVAISGKNFAVETRGLAEESLNVDLSAEGNLSISNNKRVNFNFWSHDRKNRVIPRILITIPEGISLKRFKLGIGAGKFESKGISLSYEDGNFEVGAGNLILKNVSGNKTSLRCGMGNMEISGKLLNQTNIDCGMGSMKIELNQAAEDCSYDLKIGLGDFKFNDEKQSGVKQFIEGDKKKNHFSVNCGMGSVNIQIRKAV
ncbi:MAG: DUF4097 family beta strand repeat-containing protein [Treponema sp.]|nr:DUF4097 family beta strand repeat-containing protein [Treponema sp.]